MFDYRQFLIHLPRPVKIVTMMVLDGLTLGIAYTLLVLLRASLSMRNIDNDILLGVISVFGTLSFLFIFGFYRWQVRFLSLRVLRELLFALIGGALLLIVFSIVLENKLSPLAAIAFIALGLSGLLGVRALAQAFLGNDTLGQAVIIYGAGTSGRQLAHALFQSGDRKPVAFIDDHPQIQNTIVLGLPVYAFSELNHLLKKYQTSEQRVTLCVALPFLDTAARRHLLSQLEQMPIHIQMLNHRILDRLATHDINEYVQDVKIEDLLGREAINPDVQLMSQQIHNKVVMVSGAGGSIGSELVRQIIEYAPLKIILVDHGEYSLYQIDHEVAQKQPLLVRRAYLANVVDQRRMQSICAKEKIETIFHAAAYKHVSIVQNNEIAGISNNVFGTQSMVNAARNTGVANFVLISTDKAVRPTGIMGASKRIAELVVQAAAQTASDEKQKTIFSMVRFGNVLGSSGSVVPIFQQQINQGGPVTVRHPKVTRYFMTIPEAAQLVIQSSSLAKGGDVFLLDMGEPVLIDNLARRMIHLMGHSVREHRLEQGVEIVYTGLRQGEKLYEELLIGGENVSQETEHPRIYRAIEQALSPAEVNVLLERLEKLMAAGLESEIHALLKMLDIGFTSETSSSDIQRIA